MYKALLCWRYLRTRFLALACIVSVTLGVATLIVVNSVMSGFSEKLRDKLHVLLADIIVESAGIEGFNDPVGKMKRIQADPFLASKIDAIGASMECFAMIQFPYPNGETLTRVVRLVGVDPDTRAELGGFKGNLTEKRAKPDFALTPQIERFWFEREKLDLEIQREKHAIENGPRSPAVVKDAGPPPPPLPPVDPGDIALAPPPPAPMLMENIKIPQGAIIGNLVAGFRTEDPETKEGKVKQLLQPGDSFVLITTKGPRVEPVHDRFIVVDYFKSDMSEYDGNLVFVDMKYLQKLRAMENGATTISIKLKNYNDAKVVVEKLEAMFPIGFRVQTWEKKQGAILAAIDIERGVLNVLLFMIVAVAGFGILAIFSMIVAEKTRDIGIMKSLGASNLGVMQIFLSYGLLLGIVGASMGTLIGVLLTVYLNNVEKFLTWLTGRHIFDPSVYYFNEIPTNIETSMLVLVNLGAVAIAVVFSILPAIRAARLHPVRALRFE